jgi:mobilome CxxCx(11)CxxC protein
VSAAGASDTAPAGTNLKALRQRCWNSAFSAFATAHIFEKRAARLRWQIRMLAFLGIAGPLLVGGLVLAFGASSSSVRWIVPVALGVGVTQLVISGWSLTADWSGAVKTSSERIWVNHALARRFQRLAETPPDALERFLHDFDILAAEEDVSERTDYQLQITDAEKRAGYRAASRHFRRACATCGLESHSLDPASDCPTCGEPSTSWRKLVFWRRLPTWHTAVQAGQPTPPIKSP